MSNQYDDSATGGFSYAEKLKLVADGNMDPKEIGLSSPNDAQIKLVGEMSPEEKLKQAKLGDSLCMEIGEVPANLRAAWAMQDLKIAVPKSEQADWIESWVDQHKGEHLLQARIRCGYVSAVMEFLCKDTVLGIIELMQKGALAVKEKYEQQLAYEKAQAENPDTNQPEQPGSGEPSGDAAVSP